MEKQSVTVRNLLGGFLGGALGILAAYYTMPGFLPVGVLVGVFIGWQNKDILTAFRAACIQARGAQEKGMHLFTQTLLPEIAKLTGLPEVVGRSAARGLIICASAIRWIVVKAVIGSLIAILMSPVAFMRFWKNAHPMDRVWVIEVCVGAMVIFGLPGVFGAVIWGRGTDPESGLFVLPILTCFIGFGAVCIYQANQDTKNGRSEISHFFHQWENLERRGYVRSALLILGRHMGYMLRVTVFSTVALALLCVGGSLMMVLSVSALPICYIIKTFYELWRRSSYRTCLAVTLLITGASWLLFREKVTDAAAAWFIALATGMVSGVAGHGTYVALEWLRRHTGFGMKLLEGKGDVADALFEEEPPIFFWAFGKTGSAQFFRRTCLGGWAVADKAT